MKISVDWIKDFVDLPEELSDRDISERITLGVCEVEGFERIGSVLNNVTVAAVTGVEPHPDADKLKLATVDLGGGKTARVVCGAPNCRTGIKVSYAAIGTALPGGFILEPKKIRGILSEGMLCAEDELGLSDDHEGLMELDSDASVGAVLADALGKESVDDLILDVDNKSLTHRPDCWDTTVWPGNSRQSSERLFKINLMRNGQTSSGRK
jgi:phenylalanyl-tRNA synthetase beta chain